MAINSIPGYDGAVSGNNTDIGGVSIAEGWPATNINNSLRTLLMQLKQYLANSATVASAGTVDLGAQTANYITISGTTTVTSFGTIAAGTWRMLEFSGAVPITYNATSMITPGAQSITAQAGDTAMVVSEGSGNWRFLSYHRNATSPISSLNAQLAQGRITLTSGTAVTTSDVTAATTVYWTPYKGNQVSVYTGSGWQLRTFAEMSIAVPATTSTMYDLFFDYNSNSPQLVATAWTNDTTRATALTTQDGVLVKSGTLTQRYLGSFRTTTVSGQTEDSVTKRYVWNNYNRVKRAMAKNDATATWTYSTTSFRQANAAAANQLDIIRGLDEDEVTITAMGATVNSTSTFRIIYTGIGLDSTTVNSANLIPGNACNNSASTNSMAFYEGLPGIGRHFFAWLEQGGGTDTQTWSGTGTTYKLGIVGSVLA